MFGLRWITLGILTYIIELCRWNTQIQYQHTIYSTEHCCFLFFQCYRFCSFSSKVTQLQAVFFQFQRNQICHTRSIITAIGFRHSFLRYQTIFTDNVGNSRKCSTITQRMLKKPFHCFVAHRFFTGVDNTLQEKIGFLQLIPEERVNLRKFKRLKIIFGNSLGTHHVQSGEEPATSGRLLICNSFGVYLHGKMSIHSCQILLIQCKFTNVIVSDGITKSLIGSGALIALFNLVQHRFADSPFSVLCLHGK